MKIAISTSIHFGGREIPVGVAGAISESKEVTFKTLHDCGNPVSLRELSGPKAKNSAAKNEEKVSPVQKKSYCEACDVEVETTIRGFEFTKGKFLTFKNEELDVFKPDEPKLITLTKFVPRVTVIPLMVSKSYFLIPNSHVSASYGQLFSSLAELKLAGIGTQNLWGKEHPVAVYAEQSFEGHPVLMMQLLHLHEDKVLPDFAAPIPSKEAKKEMKELLTSLAGELLEGDLVSSQRVRLNDLIAAKLQALQQPKPELVEALKPRRKKVAA